MNIFSMNILKKNKENQMTTNVNSVKQDIEDAKRKLEEAQQKLIELESRESKESQKKVWRPTHGNPGCSLHGSGHILHNSSWMDSKEYYETGSCFPTREAAEKELARRKLMHKMRVAVEEANLKCPDKQGPYEDHYEITFSTDDSTLEVINTGNSGVFSPLFPTRASAEAFLKEHRKELESLF